jgi:hypothetical protein
MIAVAAALLLLAACATANRGEMALAARSALIGLPKTELLSCAGVPERSRTEGNVEYFTYGSGQLVEYPGTTVGLGFGTYYGTRHPYYGLGWGVPLATEVRSDYCETTFTIVDGVVTNVNYVSASGVGTRRFSQCYYTIQNCLRPVANGAPGPAPGAPGPAPAPRPAPAPQQAPMN